MAGIKSIKAKKITDSRGRLTVEAEVTTDSGRFFASVPSGTSMGKFEAKAKEAKVAVKNINEVISPKIVGKSAISQKQVDDLLVKDKSHLGANATLAVSIAVLRGGAKAQKLSLWKWISKIAGTRPKLPFPSVLQVEGGLHGSKGGADIQEFMTVFQGRSFRENLSRGIKVYKVLKIVLTKRYGEKAVRLGLEGAFIPLIKKFEEGRLSFLPSLRKRSSETEEILDLIMEAAEKAGLQNKVKIILDIAVSHSRASAKGEEESLLSSPSYYLGLAKQYPILGFEDPFPEDDWKNWRAIMSKVKSQKSKIIIIGDDLTVTNPERIRRAYKKRACNAVIIKPNQIGTVSEAIAAAKLAKSFGWKIMVSHRSGETMDDFIADLAVGIGADFIKSGAPSRPERMAKYNRLLKIEKELCQN